ncbi:MAG: hypothetical protein IJU36_07205 [Paludibacteraceae bacterium]|nr:hypothetical protein [Paludibacteraceae bacterium]
MSEVNNTLQQNTIIFRMGEETGIVIEKTKEQFEHSLFREQYKQAFELMDELIHISRTKSQISVEQSISNVIAFCGDRGEGKTSALSTICRILSDRVSFKNAKDAGLLVNTQNIEDNTSLVLPLVDPSFFDDEHNIIELVIGQMYEKVTKDSMNPQSDDNIQKSGYRTLMENFAKAKKCLSALVNTSDMYDSISELSRLAANVNLRSEMENLFKTYSEYYKKEVVVISVDDIDLNMNEAYKMAENIRKYLCNRYCVVLLAVKIDQLQKAIHAAIRKNLSDKDIVSDEQVAEMAQKYVTKFIPENHRMIMPSPDDIIENTMMLYDENNNLLPNINKLSGKETIVRLIFNKTRFIFYNGRSVSPIVPHNLREINLLVGLLLGMSDIYDYDGERIEDELLTNKVIFKNYFYKSWVNNNLTKGDRDFATQLAKYKDIISTNKFVISYLNKRFETELGTGNTDELFKEIIERQNKSHNISVGDVYYVAKQIETITTDTKIHLLLFFVRSYYSMRLYELYDEITKPSNLSDNYLGRIESASKVRIYKYDSLYERTNVLQRFLNGSYFSYQPGSLINDTNEGMHRDIRPINGKNLSQILQEATKMLQTTHQAYIKAKFAAQAKNENFDGQCNFTEEEKLIIRRCEYFILCTTHQLKGPDAIKNRQSVNPPFIGIYDNIDRQYLYYDFLAIFYNIINIRYAFSRFGKEGKLLYRYVRKFPWTLTYQLTARNTDESLPEKVCREELLSHFHEMLSDGCIRVSEVQQSIVEELTKNKLSNKHKDNAKNVYKLRCAYEDIQNLEISLYPYSMEHKSYRIHFDFLNPLIYYLKEEEKSESSGFDVIFNVQKDSFISRSSGGAHIEEFYNQFPKARRSRAEWRGSIINMLRTNRKDLPERGDVFWKEIFPDSKYTKKEDWIKRCIEAKNKLYKYSE